MFESAELGHTVDKDTYNREVPVLREALLDAQHELTLGGRFPLLILIGGVDGAGKGETVNLLNSWLDPRYVRIRAMDDPSDEEKQRPPMFRFWRALPPKGTTGIFFGSWYSQPILNRAYGRIKGAELDETLDEIVRLEHMLTAEGALLLKFWFHISKAEQKRRLKQLEAHASTRWRVTPLEWKHHKLYDTFRQICERTIRRTSTPDAPWTVVDGHDERHRSLAVGREVLRALRTRLDAEAAKKAAEPKPAAATPTKGGRSKKVSAPAAAPKVSRRSLAATRIATDTDILGSLDLTKSISDKKYGKELALLQGRLNLISRHPRFRKHSLVVAFEGVDAAGKGGAIRRVSEALDARLYHIVPIAAPTQEERAQPYLWRFWRHVPGKGRVCIFDRTWYGRVLVERVEGFAAPADWGRAYVEINDFEEQLIQNRTVLCKFWLQISKEEQLRRFEERQKIAFKRYKITAEDWRNRDRWEDYERAVCEMVDRTSTEIAPWCLVEANDKNHARIKVMRTLCDRLEERL